MLLLSIFRSSYFIFLLAVFTGLLTACNKEKPGLSSLPDACPDVEMIAISDEELKNIIYSDYKYYEGFYNEPGRRNSIYFENTSSIRENADRKYLCTDDYNTAADWSERSAKNASYYRALVASRENEKYFEFIRASRGTRRDTLLSRVFKCTYLDRSMEKQLDQNQWIVGMFNQKPRTAANTLEVVEFLNYISSYNIGGKKYIANEVCEAKSQFRIVLFETGVVYGDWGLHDEISLFQNTYTIDKLTGLIIREIKLLRKIKGKLN